MSPIRIVTLLPAATEIVCALGLRESLFGRSHECDFPADVAGLPALTRARVDSALPSERLDQEVRRILADRLPLYMLDSARLAALAPDVVVTQEACEVCAVSYDQVVSSLKRTAYRAAVVSLKPTRLGDVLSDVRTVAGACGVPDRGARLEAEMRARLEAVAAGWSAGARPRVAVVEWLSPLMLAGHWVPETVEAAGGVAVGPMAGVPSRYASWDELRSLRPDAVVVAPCGFDLARTQAEAEPWLPVLLGLARRVVLVDGNAYFNRPGPRIVEAVETLAAWLRGEPVPPERGRALEAGALSPT